MKESLCSSCERIGPTLTLDQLSHYPPDDIARLLARPEPGDGHIYQYAVIRRDLQMTSGKLAAQSGHAFGDAMEHAQRIAPELASLYRNDETGGSKVVLSAKNDRQLLRAYQQAIEQGLPCSLIVDQHHIMPPHFDGGPVITAIGIGPCTKDQARAITKRFQCL